MEGHGVSIRGMRVLRGPNLFAYMPVLQSRSISVHTRSSPGGVIERLQRGAYLAHIVDAAWRRNVPATRLTPEGSLVQLGWGVNQQRIWACETSNTSAIAVELCQEKPLTNRLLRMVGLPVPEGEPATSADTAWRAAQVISDPVVVKPDAGNQGKSVSTDLTSAAEVRSARVAISRSAGVDTSIVRPTDWLTGYP